MSETPEITRIVYTEKKYLGNYETCEVQAECSVPPGIDPGVVMKRLKKWVGVQVDAGPYTETEGGYK